MKETQMNTIRKISGFILLLLFFYIIVIVPSINKNESEIQREVQIVGDIQTIKVIANNYGYTPSIINAKAGIPLKLNMTTDGSIGCQNSFRIPELNVSKILSNGVIEEILIPSQQTGKVITAACSMNMYKIKIKYT